MKWRWEREGEGGGGTEGRGRAERGRGLSERGAGSEHVGRQQGEGRGVGVARAFLCSFLGLLGAALGAAALAEAGLALSAPLAISARRSRILASRLARSSSHAADA